MNAGELINTPGYYYAIAYWGSMMMYSTFLPRRKALQPTWIIRIFFLPVIVVWMTLTDGVPQMIFPLTMAVNIFLIFCFFHATCRIDTAKSVYYCVRAFILGEFTASFGWQIYYYSQRQVPWLKNPAANVVFVIVTYGISLAVAYYVEHTFAREDVELLITKRELVSSATIVAIAFIVSNISYLYGHTPFSSTFPYEVFIIRTLADLGGVAILYAYHIQLVRLQNQMEARNLQNILEMQYTNYQISGQSMELVNQKYHDLKQQIAILKAGAVSGEEMVSSLERMEEEIKSYEAQNKTGNKVLDTILTGKTLYCQGKGIQLSCIADGTALEFLELMDLSALFGNILDNAIENTEKVSDPKKRLIHLTVAVQKGFLRIRCENYFDGEVTIRNGLPVTTKSDKRYHGYGFKSIRSIAKKYGGSATFEAKDHWFEVRILFPVQNGGSSMEKTHTS